jgi:hypothetical protein
MALTGVPLIAVCVLLTLAAGAGTVLLWSRSGRWRTVVRPVALVLCEALVVLSAGLVANRHEQFYPSWAALKGDTGTVTRTATQAAGRLDGSFGPSRLRTPWQPAGSAGWHLASSAHVAVPRAYLGGHGSYPALLGLGGGSYPALLGLGGRPAPAGLVRVTVDPGRQTTAAELATLPSLLATDFRVTGHGWALVTSSACASLATQLIRDDPGRFAALAVVGGLPKTVRHRFGPTLLTGSWAAATAWAVAQTPLPLAAPEVLPRGGVR